MNIFASMSALSEKYVKMSCGADAMVPGDLHQR